MQLVQTLVAVTYSFSALGVGWVSLSPAQPGLAQSANADLTPTQYAAPEDLEERDRPPGRSRGGASRGDCPIEANQPELTALAPSTDIAVDQTPPTVSPSNLSRYESVLSLTTEAYPSFWFYVPDPPHPTITLEFVLQDIGGNTLYQTQLTAAKDRLGVIQVSLPETASPLKVNETYQWYFLTHCDLSSPEDPSYVQGWIARTPVNEAFQAQLDTASPLEKASLYAAEGIWQDAVTHLGELYRADPQNPTLRNQWVSLLTSVGLADLANIPLVDCCAVPAVERVGWVEERGV